MKSHRSGATEDDYIADLAVGLRTGEATTGEAATGDDMGALVLQQRFVMALGAIQIARGLGSACGGSRRFV